MVPEIHKILFASDLSEQARCAFDHAARVAAWSGAPIIILHVMEELTPGAEDRLAEAFGRDIYKDLKNRKKEGARDILIHKKTEAPRIRDFLADMCAQAGGGRNPAQDVIEDILVVEGNIADEIISTAAEKNCDLIVMGSRQRNFLAEAFSGSVVRKVLRRTQKPVYVVPLPE